MTPVSKGNLTKGDVMANLGDIINKCPSCNFKNITYSQFCDSCGFSWEKYAKQENQNICDGCHTEIKFSEMYGADDENNEIFCKDCVD